MNWESSALDKYYLDIGNFFILCNGGAVMDSLIIIELLFVMSFQLKIKWSFNFLSTT